MTNLEQLAAAVNAPGTPEQKRASAEQAIARMAPHERADLATRLIAGQLAAPVTVPSAGPIQQPSATPIQSDEQATQRGVAIVKGALLKSGGGYDTNDAFVQGVFATLDALESKMGCEHAAALKKSLLDEKVFAPKAPAEKSGGRTVISMKSVRAAFCKKAAA
jgi:hypothetical protein